MNSNCNIPQINNHATFFEIHITWKSISIACKNFSTSHTMMIQYICTLTLACNILTLAQIHVYKTWHAPYQTQYDIHQIWISYMHCVQWLHIFLQTALHTLAVLWPTIGKQIWGISLCKLARVTFWGHKMLQASPGILRINYKPHSAS